MKHAKACVEETGTFEEPWVNDAATSENALIKLVLFRYQPPMMIQGASLRMVVREYMHHTHHGSICLE